MRATGVADGWLYAVGDVNGRNLLTHMGKYQARVCGDVIAARAKGEPDDLPGMRDIADGHGAPQVVFTDPQVCAVGLTEAGPAPRGFDVRVVEYDWAGGRRLPARRRLPGRAKAVVDERRRVLLGVTFVGPGRGRAAARRDDRGHRRGDPRPAAGTPCRRSRPSARSGCACWRPTGSERPRARGSAAEPGRTPPRGAAGLTGDPCGTRELDQGRPGARSSKTGPESSAGPEGRPRRGLPTSRGRG